MIAQMGINNIPTAQLGFIVAQLVQQGLTFAVWPHDTRYVNQNNDDVDNVVQVDSWNIELTGGY